jgi:hypothetical protein
MPPLPPPAPAPAAPALCPPPQRLRIAIRDALPENSAVRLRLRLLPEIAPQARSRFRAENIAVTPACVAVIPIWRSAWLCKGPDRLRLSTENQPRSETKHVQANRPKHASIAFSFAGSCARRRFVPLCCAPRPPCQFACSTAPNVEAWKRSSGRECRPLSVHCPLFTVHVHYPLSTVLWVRRQARGPEGLNAVAAACNRRFRPGSAPSTGLRISHFNLPSTPAPVFVPAASQRAELMSFLIRRHGRLTRSPFSGLSTPTSPRPRSGATEARRAAEVPAAICFPLVLSLCTERQREVSGSSACTT